MLNRGRFLAVLLCLTLGAASVQAANKYWDIDGANPGAGGAAPSGDWNAAGVTNWTTDSTGSSTATTFANNDIGIFSSGTDATGSFTITLTGPILANGVTVEEGTLLFTGANANTLNGGTTAGLIIDIASGLTTTFATKMSATQNNPYKKRGAGTAVLTGANTFACPLQIENGTVSVATINAANAVGPLGEGINDAKEIMLGTTGGNTGTLRYTGGTVSVSSNRRFQIKSGGTGVFQIDGAGVIVTIPGFITNSTTADANGLIKKTGAGVLKVSNAGNTYGNVTISEGAFQVTGVANAGNACALGRGSAISIEGGSASTFSFTGSAASMDRSFVIGSGGGAIESTTDILTLTGGITSSPANQPLFIGGAGSVTITNTALNIGTGNLTMNGSGALTLSAANTYGATIISNGVVEARLSGSLSTGNVTVASSGKLKLSNASAMAPGAILTLADSPVTNTVNLNFSGTQNINRLFFGATQKAAGSWGAVGSSATHQNAAFTGTGLLNVTNGPSSSTALASSSDPAAYGAVVLTATVTGAGGTPTGTVTFKEGANVLGAAPLVAGVATFNPGNSLPAGGPFSLTAVYGGDDNFGSSTSNPLSQTVTNTPLLIKADDKTKNYGGTAPLTFTASGLVSGDTVGSATLTCLEAADTNAVPGSYTIVPSAASGGTFNPANYSITYSNGALTVNQAPLSIKADDKSKPYGGTVALTFTPAGLKNGETIGSVTLTCTQSADVTAPIGSYPITASAATGGTVDTNNYILSYVNGTLTVTNANLTVAGIEAVDKVYDGTTNATIIVSNGVLVGVMNGDLLTLSTTNATGAFTNKTVGVGKLVRISGLEVYGDLATNYTLIQPTTNASITTKPITVTATADSRVYDGTTNSTGVPTVSPGVALGDTANFAQSYDTRNVGTGKILTPTGSVNDGTGGANYNVTFGTATGEITNKPITVTAVADSRTYDGTTNSAGVPNLNPGVAAGDTANFTQTYDTRNVGAGKTLTPGGTVNDGNGGSNYNITFANTSTGVITNKPITVTAVAGSKVYDGTTNSSGIPTVSPGLGAGDTPNFSQSYDTKNVGTNKTLTPAGSVTDGNGGANYNISFANNSSGVITALTTACVLNSTPNPSGPGTNITFTATISGVPPAADQPTGDVVFLASGVPFSTNATSGGVAVATNTSLPVGTNTIQARYLGDGNFLTSTGTVAQVIQSAVTCSATNALLSIANNLDGRFTLTFLGTPQAQYYVLGSSSVSAPINTWTPLPGSTNTVTNLSGIWQFIVTNTARQQFYRGAAVSPCP